MGVCGYKRYIWVYSLGTVLTLVNGLVWHSDWLGILCLLVLYGILFYKGIHILVCYKKSDNRGAQVDKKAFGNTYGTFRLRVALFWLAFIGLCVLGKFVLHLGRVYFYGCTFFFLFLDRWFVNVICLLQKLSDPKGTTVLCCCGCPCRGWDLLMIHTPLLFALDRVGDVENILIVLSSALAIGSFICWETQKYHLVEVRRKCTTPCDLAMCKEHHSGQISDTTPERAQ